MVAIKTTLAAMASLQPRHRRVLSTKTRSDIFHQMKRHVVHKFTPEERKEISKRRSTRKDKVEKALAQAVVDIRATAQKVANELGGEMEYWRRKLMQNARIAVTRRKVNRWNAFLSKRLEEINAS